MFQFTYSCWQKALIIGRVTGSWTFVEDSDPFLCLAVEVQGAKTKGPIIGACSQFFTSRLHNKCIFTHSHWQKALIIGRVAGSATRFLCLSAAQLQGGFLTCEILPTIRVAKA